MPLGDVTEQQAFISAYFGADDSGVPSSFDAALFTGNPYDEGVEVDYPGYDRVTVTNNTTNFVPGADGSATAEVSFPDATDAAGTGSSVVTDDGLAWVLYNGSAISAWEFLDSSVAVDGAGSVEPIEVTVYHPNDDSVVD